MKEKFVGASFLIVCCSLLYSPSMGDSSILLTGGTKQHCHSCNICRNKELIFFAKSGQNQTKVGTSGSNHITINPPYWWNKTTLSQLRHLQKQSIIFLVKSEQNQTKVDKK